MSPALVLGTPRLWTSMVRRSLVIYKGSALASQVQQLHWSRWSGMSSYALLNTVALFTDPDSSLLHEGVPLWGASCPHEPLS